MGEYSMHEGEEKFVKHFHQKTRKGEIQTQMGTYCKDESCRNRVG